MDFYGIQTVSWYGTTDVTDIREVIFLRWLTILKYCHVRTF